MPMSLTEIIEPEVFSSYIREAIIEKSALIGSGIVAQNKELSDLVSGGGRTLNMPRWKRPGGRSEILVPGQALTPAHIGTDNCIATMHHRGKAWEASELVSSIAGDSAIDAITDYVSEWWTRDEQQVLISTLVGMCAAPTMADHVENQSTKEIDAFMTLDAKQRLGDAADQLSAILMHSKTFTTLQKKNLIDYIPDARGEIAFNTYLGYRIIVDDTMPVSSGVYSTLLVANGVIGRGDGVPVDQTSVEIDRDSLAGTDYLIHRRAYVLHPVGLSWIGEAASTTPSDTELRTGANWKRVWDSKHIGFVVLKHTV